MQVEAVNLHLCHYTRKGCEFNINSVRIFNSHLLKIYKKVEYQPLNIQCLKFNRKAESAVSDLNASSNEA